MTRAKQGAASLALTLALSLAAPAAVAQTWNHDPASTIGPGFWGSIAYPFATCGSKFDPVANVENAAVVEVGRKQTPVDIVPSTTIAALLPPLLFAYNATPFEVENTGHTVEVAYASRSRPRGRGVP